LRIRKPLGPKTNLLKEVGFGPKWLANPQTLNLNPLLNLGELLK